MFTDFCKWLQRLFFSPSADAFPPSDSAPESTATLMEAEKMASELSDYLIGDRLFRQIVVDTPAGLRQPKMTLGGLVERMQALASDPQLGPGDRRRLHAVQEAWETARRRYPEQVTEKLQREMKSYLHNWQYYLDQRAQNPEKWKNDYAYEARNKRRVQLVVRLLGADAPTGILDDLEAMEPHD